MILQQLHHDAPRILENEDFMPPMYRPQTVRWDIRIDRDGKHSFLPLGEPGKKGGVSRILPYPGPRSGNVLRPNLLIDTPAYVLGRDPEDSRAAVKHAAFKALVRRCAEDTGDFSVAAIAAFLDAWNPDASEVPLALTRMDNITFRVNGVFPVDDDDVRAFWARSARPVAPKGAEREFECLITGVPGPVDKSLSGTIKGIPGGQTGGLALISANERAFESYGLERAETAPISREAAERFTKALNYLISGERTHRTIGGLVYVFWNQRGGDQRVSSALVEPKQFKDMMELALAGKDPSYFPKDRFHAIALSANAARAVVRDQLTTTVENAYGNLLTWVQAHTIVGLNGEDAEPLGIDRLARSIYRDPKELIPSTSRAFIASALHGTRLPLPFLGKAVQRCRVEHKVTYERAALIKAVLSFEQDSPQREEWTQRMTGLDEDNRDPAYVCGRALAVMDNIQFQAQGRLNSTIVDRFFAAAAASPRRILGTVLLEKATRAHLAKLRRSKYGAYINRKRELENVLALLSPDHYPESLSLKDQAIFMLGFYHQSAAITKRNKDASAKASASGNAANDGSDSTEGNE